MNTANKLKQSDRVKPIGYQGKNYMTLNNIPVDQQDGFYNYWINALNKPVEDCFGMFDYSIYRDWFNSNLEK